MKKFFKAFIADNSGAAAAEYALILGVIGAGIILGALALGGSIKTSMTNSGKTIEGKALTDPGTGTNP
jgi:pilus assembly protein Flp/PilA